ncbi:MAG: spherulation-specific family 4 protein [Nitrososphaerales archaeon]
MKNITRLPNHRSIILVICVLATLAIAVSVPIYSTYMKNQAAQSQLGQTVSLSEGSNTTIYDPVQTTASTSTTFSKVQPRIALPLYSQSISDWQKVLNSAPAEGIVVLNANYGPGNSYDPSFVTTVTLAKMSGAKVLGYVYTNYADGSIPVSEVEQWINDWYTWYHINGIFFDEVQSICTNQSIAYYTALYNYTKSEPGSDIVVLNPGNTTGECYASISDILVTFEGNYADYLTSYNNTSWTNNYPPSHFWHIVYNATTVTEMQNAIQLASQRGAAWIYVSDGLAHGVNALGRLPIYFCEEAQYLDPGINSCNANTNTTETNTTVTNATVTSASYST